MELNVQNPSKNGDRSIDNRRKLIIPGNQEATISFAVTQFLEIGKKAIEERQKFTVALSGGQTPHAIFKELSKPIYFNALDWSKVICFWSDERNSPPDNLENNYFSAMRAGLSALPLLPENIFRMHAEENIEKNASHYEELIKEKVPGCQFDLVMLGMGEDGHTASLFPHTEALHVKERLVVENFVKQKNTWRMTFTYESIHLARNICIYVMGENKAKTVAEVLLGPYEPEHFPIQAVGTLSHPAMWILDTSASSLL